MFSFFQTNWQKICWAVIIIAAIIALGAILVLNNTFYQDYLSNIANLIEPLPQAPNPLVRIAVDFGNGEKRAFEGEVVPGMTAGDALVFSSQAGKFEVKFSRDRMKVVSIDGVSNTTKKNWNFYLNDSGTPEKSILLALKGKETLNFVYK